MKKDEFEERLDNLKISNIAPPRQDHLKLAIVGAKKSLRISLWLLAIPFSVLFGAMVETVFHIAIPPWSLIKHYGRLSPLWLRVDIFTTVVIICPLIAVLLNLLAITYVNYERDQKVFHISIRLRTANVVVLAVAGVIAMAFIGHSIADWIAGH